MDEESPLLMRDGASLRDPSGYVFEFEGRIYRRLIGAAAQEWLQFSALPLASALMDQGQLVRSTPAQPAATSFYADLDPPGVRDEDRAGLVLAHERIPLISYAQEWSFSMLRDAARLHLTLMSQLLPAGWVLKDASPANVQWHAGRLTFIDVASIEPYRGGPWRAYGQFCKTMLFPLLVSAHGNFPLQPLLKGHLIGGMEAATADGLLRGLSAKFKPGVLMHVWLQSWLHRLSSGRREADTPRQDVGMLVDADAVLRMVRGLLRVLDALPNPRATAWTGYRFDCTYDERQLEDKRATVEAWCATHMGPSDVALDVGCNTGEYSAILARHAGSVVGIDADMPCIDEIYRRGDARVLPLVVDFASPTPSAGWALREQKAFGERVRPTWGVWLAVIHHLAVHNGVRLDEVVRRMMDVAPRHIVEFVAPEDAMVRALLSERAISRPDYSLANFLALLDKNGVKILEHHPVTATRTLYLLVRPEAGRVMQSFA